MLLYLLAYLFTAVLHVEYQALLIHAAVLVGVCLTDAKIPILRAILQLQTLVLCCFIAGVLLNVASAEHQQPLRTAPSTLNFDDIQTERAWADIPLNYHQLDFPGFYAFAPADNHLKDRISPDDLNCAASQPNALYGTRYNLPSPANQVPTIKIHSSTSKSFQLHSMKVKPLSIPLGYTKLVLNGTKLNNKTILWDVDFPMGYNEMLNVDMVAFSNATWDKLQSLSIYADFHNGESVMDWEFCVDDLNVTINS